MKPILFITDLAVGGMQRVCVTLCNEWTAQGKAFLLYVSYLDGKMREKIQAKGQVYFANTPARFALFKLLRLCRANKDSPLLIINAELGILLLLLKRLGLIRNRIVFRESTAVRSHCSKFWKTCYRWFVARADAFIVQSPAIAVALIELFGDRGSLLNAKQANSVTIIRNPSIFINWRSPDMFIRRNGDKIRFLMVGRLVELKGHIRVLEVLSKSQGMDWRLSLVGDGTSKDEIEKKISGLGVSARVDLHGGSLDVRPYYEASDIVIMASKYEGLPSVLIEAIACGCRILVVENDGGTGEFIRSLGLGEFIVKRDEFDQHFETCVQKVLDSDCVMWEKAYEQMAGMVHPKIVAEQVWKVLEGTC